MRIVIYNTNSFGGNYEYSKYLSEAYAKHGQVTDVQVHVPQNQNGNESRHFVQSLLPDLSGYNNKLLKKAFFIYRSIVNPFRFYKALKHSEPSIVIFNDYDQMTSLFWAPLFRKLKKKHLFSVILHDPDRDAYMPWRWLSSFSMKKVMSIMDLAFYHGRLPQKEYYENDVWKLEVPHGLYHHQGYDSKLHDRLIQLKGDFKYISILGNIRDEKNYSLVIEALQYLPHVKLLIAGRMAHSGVPVDEYKSLSERLNVADRIVWIEKFMTDDEFQSAVFVSDVVLLYYKESFTSQSGVLNLIAPHKKCVLVSDTPSALHETVVQFGFGEVVPLSPEALVKAVESAIGNSSEKYSAGWDKYIQHASWDKHVSLAIDSFNKKIT